MGISRNQGPLFESHSDQDHNDIHIGVHFEECNRDPGSPWQDRLGSLDTEQTAWGYCGLALWLLPPVMTPNGTNKGLLGAIMDHKCQPLLQNILKASNARLATGSISSCFRGVPLYLLLSALRILPSEHCATILYMF